MQPLVNRIASLEQNITNLPRTASAPGTANAGQALQDRLDLAITSLSQRQNVNDQNMASLRNQVSQTKNANDSMGLQLASFNKEVAPLINRVTAVEQTISLQATQTTRDPGVQRDLVALDQQLQQHQQQIQILSTRSPDNLNASITAIQQEQFRLAQENQNQVDRSTLEIVEAKVGALSRQVIAMENTRMGQPAAGIVPNNQDLVVLRQQLADANNQLGIAKRERAALQRDQLRFLSLEKKVRTLSQQPTPAGIPTPATGMGSVATQALPRTGGSAKKAEVMKVLGNLIGLQMNEYQTTRGTGIGPSPTDFNAAFGSRAPANTIDSELAEGVALTAIQGLFEILDAQDRRIIELEKKLSTIAP